MFILFNIAVGIVAAKVVHNTEECSVVTSKMSSGLELAKGMVTCLKAKNGLLGNWLMASIYRAVDAMPHVPKEFVGVWEASQPRCTYRHKLLESGEFISEPFECSLSAETFHGTWGVHDNQMIWMVDEGVVWPPDINSMDVVDKDFFLLVEQDGTRTRFTRVKEVQIVTPTIDMGPEKVQSSEAETSLGDAKVDVKTEAASQIADPIAEEDANPYDVQNENVQEGKNTDIGEEASHLSEPVEVLVEK
ncbi:MAG: hypothetical protein HZB47_11055 [Nitrosomonadales bacterium]|nr:hypothetical protein [Nitrosomonadales bacterium]